MSLPVPENLEDECVPDVELPSPQAGKVVRIHGGPGDKINVGEPLIVFEVPDNTAGIVGTVPKEEAPKRRVRLSAVLDED